MRKSVLLSLVLIMLVSISCNAQPGQKPVPAVSKNTNIDVYYFHMTNRCVTCKTVEAEARKDIEMLYADQVKAGTVNFTAFNLEEARGKTVGESVGVNSQTLLIVKGDQKINITNEGFLYAVSQPDKFREVIKSKIDPLIK